MAAYFTLSATQWEHALEDRIVTWHIGEPMPEALRTRRIIQVQADGDELTQILATLFPNMT